MDSVTYQELLSDFQLVQNGIGPSRVTKCSFNLLIIILNLHKIIITILGACQAVAWAQ